MRLAFSAIALICAIAATILWSRRGTAPENRVRGADAQKSDQSISPEGSSRIASRRSERTAHARQHPELPSRGPSAAYETANLEAPAEMEAIRRAIIKHLLEQGELERLKACVKTAAIDRVRFEFSVDVAAGSILVREGGLDSVGGILGEDVVRCANDAVLSVRGETWRLSDSSPELRYAGPIDVWLRLR